MDINNPPAYVPYLLSVDNELLRIKRLDIGPWDMDTDSVILVPHGLGSDWTKAFPAGMMISNDADTLHFPLPTTDYGVIKGMNAYIMYIDNTNVWLGRVPTGQFDNTNYNDAVMNRGYILLWMVP